MSESPTTYQKNSNNQVATTIGLYVYEEIGEELPGKHLTTWWTSTRDIKSDKDPIHINKPEKI